MAHFQIFATSITRFNLHVFISRYPPLHTLFLFIDYIFRKMTDPRLAQWFHAVDKVSKTYFLQTLSLMSL